jgi:hypothetical protein
VGAEEGFAEPVSLFLSMVREADLEGRAECLSLNGYFGAYSGHSLWNRLCGVTKDPMRYMGVLFAVMSVAVGSLG